MYESHFGFTGSPFQLNPDPAFYFDSKGHSSALAYLKFGAHQGEGFIVVTGDIGAGKTTLVRTLLDGLDPKQVVAAQVVSTQLESSELLQAILMAFGVRCGSASKAHLIASLEGFLMTLAAKGQRALLIIDEAQNLKHEAVEELRMLSNFQLGSYGLLQSFLVGQPELRTLLQSKSMEQLRQRVIASCHLGPLAPAETRAYVEHRLRRVGWAGQRPAFAPSSFESVHRWTGGVPRKINRLCNRMLLGAFLTGAKSISPQLVDATAAELRDEISEPHALVTPEDDIVAAAAVATSLPQEIAPVPPAQPQPAASVPVTDAAVQAQKLGSSAVEPAPSLESKPVRVRPESTRRSHRAGTLVRPLLCLVDSPTDYLLAGTLQDVFQGFPSLPAVVAVHLGFEPDICTEELESRALPLPAAGLHLGVGSGGFATRASSVLDALNRVIDDFDPCAVVVLGSSDDDLACSLLAHKRGLRLMRLGSGRRDSRGAAGSQVNAVLIERVVDLHFTESTESFYALFREGIRLDRVRSVGDLTKEMFEHALTIIDSRPAAPQAGTPASGVAFGLVRAELDALPGNGAAVQEIVDLLRAYAKELPLVWVARAGLFEHLRESAHGAELKRSGVTIVQDQGYLATLALLRRSRCLLALEEDGALMEDARALHLPTMLIAIDAPTEATAVVAPESSIDSGASHARLRLARLLAEGSPRTDTPEYWHVGTASRIAGQLVSWLPKASSRQPNEPAPTTSRDSPAETSLVAESAS